MKTYVVPILTRKGRECDPSEVIRQIGRMNTYAISGGVWGSLRDSENQEITIGVWLACGANRMVEVSLDYDDTYRVRRVRRIVKGAEKDTAVIESEVSGIYCDQLAEVAYRASCWK